MRFNVFDRWGEPNGVLADIVSAIHRDELNGEDSLTLTLATCDLIKGNRIVWRDKFGVWHEHIVNDLKQVHEDGRIYTTAYCENSLAELFTDYIEDLRPYNVSATVALQRALSVTRWTVGAVDVQGTGSAIFYHTSAREALSLITRNWGGELSATIQVSGSRVSSRKVNITIRGHDHGKRFEWRKDIKGITRKVLADDVCTALYGYGKGLELYDGDGNPTGGYGRKLTFGPINGGLDYVADEDAKQIWGVPDGNGGKKHAFGKVEFSDCEDMGELLRLTRAELQKRKQPQVSYSASVIDLADAGYEFEDVSTGDTVAIIDRELGERLTGRVLRVERDLFSESATVITIGNIVRTIHDVISEQLKSLYSLRDRSAAWDGAAMISDSYINGVINAWNAAMNETGGYAYQRPGEGIVVYDRPEDQNPTMAIQLKGAGFRIANSKKPNGEWDWRTFGTGDGFTADELNVGVIRGGANWWNLETGDLMFVHGGIYDSGGNNWWNLDTGEFRMSSTANLGGRTVQQMLDDIEDAGDAVTALDNSLTQAEVFKRLTNNGSIQGLYMRNGQLYVNASYIASGTLKLGGANNTNGTLIVYNQNGAVIAMLNKDGLSATGDLNIEKATSKTLGHAAITSGTFYPRTSGAGMENLGFVIRSKCLLAGNYEGHQNTIQMFPNYQGRLGNSVIFADSPLEIQSQMHNNAPYSISGGMNPTGNTTKLVIGRSGLSLYFDHLNSGPNTSPVFAVDQNGAMQVKSIVVAGDFKVSNPTSDIRLWGDCDINGAVDVSSNVVVHGNMVVAGNKPRIVETDGYGTLTQYAYETPSPMFGDVGSAHVGDDGICIVGIDDRFAATVRVDYSYQVFLQKCGDGDVFVSEKRISCFVVRGTPGLAFDWEIKARQMGFENLRLDSFTVDNSQYDLLTESERRACTLRDSYIGQQATAPSYESPVSEIEKLYEAENQGGADELAV